MKAMKIGIDIQSTAPMKRFINTDKMARMFTEMEIAYMRDKNFSLATAAGLYCAKEAFFKAIGTGIGSPASMLNVEILHTETGAPYYNIASLIMEKHNIGNSNISLSISHTKSTAVAVCIIC